MTQQFTVIVERDPESGWLVANVAELPGCCTQAQNMTDLDRNVSEAIQLYVDQYNQLVEKL